MIPIHCLQLLLGCFFSSKDHSSLNKRKNLHTINKGKRKYMNIAVLGGCFNIFISTVTNADLSSPRHITNPLSNS